MSTTIYRTSSLSNMNDLDKALDDLKDCFFNFDLTLENGLDGEPQRNSSEIADQSPVTQPTVTLEEFQEIENASISSTEEVNQQHKDESEEDSKPSDIQQEESMLIPPTLSADATAAKSELELELQAVFEKFSNKSWPEQDFDKKFKIHCYVEDIRSTDAPKPMNEWVVLENAGIESLAWKLQKLTAAFSDELTKNLSTNCEDTKTTDQKIMPLVLALPQVVPRVPLDTTTTVKPIPKKKAPFHPPKQEPDKVDSNVPKRIINKLPPPLIDIDPLKLMPKERRNSTLAIDDNPSAQAPKLPTLPTTQEIPPTLPPKKKNMWNFIKQ